jgi:AcrR family transcriptional regulator
MQSVARSRKASPSLKPKLLDEAFVLLDREGPDGVTIRAVARAAGVSHAAPANHFADRRQLLTEMAAIIFGQYLEEVNTRAGATGGDRARAYLAALFEYAQSHPSRYELLWRKDLVEWDNPAFLDKLDQAYRDFLQSLDALRGPPGVGARDVETLGTALWAMVHGYALLRSTAIFEARSDASTGKPRIDAMLDLLLDAGEGSDPCTYKR